MSKKSESIRLGIIVFVGLLYNSLVVLFSLVMMKLTDSLIAQQQDRFNVYLISGGIIIVLQVSAFMMLTVHKNRYLKNKMIALRDQLMSKIFTFKTSHYHKSNISDYLSFIFNDLNRLKERYFQKKLEIIENALLLALSITGVIFVYPQFSYIIIGMILVAVGIPILFSKKSQKYSYRLSSVNRQAMQKFEEFFQGFDVIKSFAIYSHIHKESKEKNNELELADYKMRLFMSLIQSVLMFMVTILTLMLFVLGGYLVFQQILTVGALIALIQLLFNIVSPIINMMSAYNNILSVKNIRKDCDEILNYKKNETNNSNYLEHIQTIEIINVNFKYPNASEESLKGIKLSFQRGKKYAILGENGCGKSTLLKLIAGFFEDYSGDVTYNGHSLTTLEEENLLSLLAYIPQETFIFDKSIYENITMFQSYPHKKVDQIMDKMHIARLIAKQEKGLKTLIGEDRLSGGEQQKIAIARALLKKSDVLLIDEADASLDTQASEELRKIILSLEDKLCIMVTHHVTEALKDFDQIIVLKDGKVREQGDYGQLIKKKGYFYNSNVAHKN